MYLEILAHGVLQWSISNKRLSVYLNKLIAVAEVKIVRGIVLSINHFISDQVYISFKKNFKAKAETDVGSELAFLMYTLCGFLFFLMPVLFFFVFFH